MQLFVLFTDSNALHVSSFTLSSSGAQETVCAVRCRIQLFLILFFCLSGAVSVQGFVGPGPTKPCTDTARDKQTDRIKNIWIRHLAAHTVSWAPDDERV